MTRSRNGKAKYLFSYSFVVICAVGSFAKGSTLSQLFRQGVIFFSFPDLDGERSINYHVQLTSTPGSEEYEELGMQAEKTCSYVQS